LVIVVAIVSACGASTSPMQPTPDAEVVTTCTTESDCGGTQPYCEPTTGTCVECRYSSHCGSAICEAQQCRVARSCKELHAELPSLTSGLYATDPGTGAIMAYCDMTTAGGGWTALLTPINAQSTTYPDVMMSTTVLSGTQSCETSTVPSYFDANGYNGIRSYACGVVTFRLDIAWTNTLAATDVMFVATLQGESTRTVELNGTSIAADATALDGGGATCAFYNGTAATTSPALNQCYTTSLNAAPHVVTSGLTGNLALAITTGPACSPSCNHGTGMNISRLFVR
jgi:hypothetical protein